MIELYISKKKYSHLDGKFLIGHLVQRVVVEDTRGGMLLVHVHIVLN